MMGWLPSTILPSEARFAHVTFAFQFAEIYVPFVGHTCVGSRQGVKCGGHIDRQHLSGRDARGFFPNNFPI
jgi:hypothetical protein